MSISLKMDVLKKVDSWFGRLYLSMIFAGVLWVVSMVLHFRLPGSMAEFFVSTLSLLPISILVQMSSGDILKRLQKAHLEFLSGLFRTIFGTFAELALATVSLLHRDALLAQTSLTGAFLVNCLLLVGLSFLMGGLESEEMQYPIVIARVSSQMLLVSLVSLVLPTAFQLWYPESDESVLQTTSRAGALTLFVVFICYFSFFYFTHSRHTQRNIENIQKYSPVRILLAQSYVVSAAPIPAESRRSDHLIALREKSLSRPRNKPRLRLIASGAVLFISCCLCVVSSVFVVSSKDVPTEVLGISKSFVGLVMVPLILSFPEQLSSMIHGRKDKVDWVIEESIASCIRIVLFILPLLVILAWMIGITDMTLFFDGFQVTILSLTVLLVNYLIHGNATWFEGVILLCTYALFANAAWHYPK